MLIVPCCPSTIWHTQKTPLTAIQRAFGWFTSGRGGLFNFHEEQPTQMELRKLGTIPWSCVGHRPTGLLWSYPGVVLRGRGGAAPGKAHPLGSGIDSSSSSSAVTSTTHLVVQCASSSTARSQPVAPAHSSALNSRALCSRRAKSKSKLSYWTVRKVLRRCNAALLGIGSSRCLVF